MTNKELKERHRISERKYRRNHSDRVKKSNHIWYKNNRKKISKKQHAKYKLATKLLKQYKANRRK